MTSKIPLTFACGWYDRTDAVRSGEITPQGINLNYLTITHPRDIFDRMMGSHEFDASEMSASEYICTYVAATSQNKTPDFAAIPVFPSRAFRHGFIAVDTNQVRLGKPKDLEGKKIGVQHYTMTAAVWIRGLLAQDGVDLSTIEWVEGAIEGPGSHGKPSSLPPLKPVKITRNEDPNKSLSQLLADGEIAATIGADLPSTFGKTPNVQRLYPDFKDVEKQYYKQHSIFPIMHLVILKRSIATQHPWIPSSLFNAFVQSKDLALRRMKFTGSLRYMLPWLPSELDDIEEVFEDGDPWPYGVEANRRTLEKLVEFLFEQGMIERKPTLEELFWPVKLDQWNI